MDDSVNATDPKKPWFAYFATGGVHAPHHVSKAYRDKYKGRFDAGWDKYREETFARQKEGQATGFDSDVWELYEVAKDFSEADDVSAQNPGKLKELQAAFDVEARQYDVLPLDDRMAAASTCRSGRTR